MGVTRQIIGSFEDISKDVLKQTASLPKDIVGKAIESLGTSAGANKQQGQAVPGGLPGSEGASRESTPLDEVEQAKDRKTKQSIARNALQYLAKRPGERELSVSEKADKEKQEKTLLEKKKQEQEEKMKLNKQSFKPRRGDLRGTTKKQSGSETGKNVRQD